MLRKLFSSHKRGRLERSHGGLRERFRCRAMLAAVVGGPPCVAEALEARRLLADPLAISGTIDSDTIYLKRNGGELDVWQELAASGPPAAIYDWASIGNLTVNGLEGDDLIILDSSGGSLVAPGGTTVDGGTGNNIINVRGLPASAALTISSGQIGWDAEIYNYSRAEVELGRRAQEGGGTLVQLASLTVTESAVVRVAMTGVPGIPGSGLNLADMQELSVGPAAQFDLAGNDMILRGTEANHDAMVDAAKSLVAGPLMNNWAGPGITSSAARQDPWGLTTLRVLDNKSDWGGPVYMAFRDRPVDQDSVLLGYTYWGDCNLDGLVNVDDYFLIDAEFMMQSLGITLRTDQDYNGVINSGDYALMDMGFNAQFYSGQPSAGAGIKLDLRVTGGAKQATLGTGSSVNLEIYAVLTGSNANLTDEAFASAFFSVMSTNLNGGVARGNLTQGQLPTGLSYNGCNPGTVQDLNADGCLDVGGSANLADYVFPRAYAVRTTASSNSILIAKLTYTVGNVVAAPIAGATTTINIVPRAHDLAPYPTAIWKEDGASRWIGAVGGRVSVGDPVIINALVLPPDLKASDVVVLGNNLKPGDIITVTGRISNTGEQPSNNCVNTFYWSSDATINTADTPLASVSTSSIAASGYQDITTTVTIPSNAVPGRTYYIGLIADTSGTSGQVNTSNDASSGVAVFIPSPPDLQSAVMTLSSATPRPGDTVTVTGRISNTGNLPSQTCANTFYWSSDAVIDLADTPLASVSTAPIAANGYQDITTTVTIPGSAVPGRTYYIGLIADTSRTSGQGDTSNDASSGVAVFIPSPPDLQSAVMTLSSATPRPGDTVTVTGRIRNTGDLPSEACSNIFYLSSDATIDMADMPLAIASAPSIDAHNYQDMNATVTIPSNVLPSLTYYIGLIADTSGTSGQVNISNDASSGVAIIIDFAPTIPGILTLNCPVRSSIGAPGNVAEWTLFDRGERAVTIAVNPFIGGLVPPLSPYLGSATVQLLGPAGNVLGMASGYGGPAILREVVLSADGTYRVQVRATAGSPDSTGNFTVTAWDSTPDVATLLLNQQVTGLIDNPFRTDRWTFAASAGQQVRLDVTGNWPGVAFDLDGPSGWNAFRDAKGDSSLVTLPYAGSYTLTAHSAGWTYDASYVCALIETSQTDLIPEVAYYGTLAGNGQAQIFRIDAPAGKYLQVQLDDANNLGSNEVYIRRGLPPTRSDYEWRYRANLAADQKLVAYSDIATTYYVLVYADVVPDAPSDYTVTASLLDFVVTDFSPARGGNAGPVTLKLQGGGFDQLGAVSLVSPSGALLNVGRTQVVSNGELWTTFDLQGAVPGLYDMCLTLKNGGFLDLPDAFTVLEGGGPDLSVNLVTPGMLRIGRTGTFFVDISNRGRNDAAIPIVWLQLPQGMAAGLDSQKSPGTFGEIRVDIPAGRLLPERILPGETVRIPVYCVATVVTSEATIGLEIYNTTLEDVSGTAGLSASADAAGELHTSLQTSQLPPLGFVSSAALGSDLMHAEYQDGKVHYYVDANYRDLQQPTDWFMGVLTSEFTEAEGWYFPRLDLEVGNHNEPWAEAWSDRMGVDFHIYHESAWIQTFRFSAQPEAYSHIPNTEGHPWPAEGVDPLFGNPTWDLLPFYYSPVYEGDSVGYFNDGPGVHGVEQVKAGAKAAQLFGLSDGKGGRAIFEKYQFETHPSAWDGTWDGSPEMVVLGNAGVEWGFLIRVYVEPDEQKQSFPFVIVGSGDPNDKLSPAGAGTQNFVAANTLLLPYTIDFENEVGATAPAQEVQVSDVLDNDLDLSTFELTDIAFGGHVITVPAGLNYYATTVDLRPEGTNLLVKIEAGLNSATRQAYWKFQSIDPVTGALTEDPLAGFLPPNDATHRGKGHVSYVIRPMAGLATGTEIRNVATIIFDNNMPITTNQIDPHDPSKGIDPAKECLNTIDAAGPVSQVEALPDVVVTPDFLVNWSGDDTGGSGIANYDIYVSADGGAYSLWLDDTTATSATFQGQAGHRYAFYSIARDNVGHVEAAPAMPDAQTTVQAADPWRGTAGDDQFTIRLDTTGTLVQFFLNVPTNQPPSFSVPLQQLQTVILDGIDGQDKLTLDLANGNPLSSVPLHVQSGHIVLQMVNGSSVLRTAGLSIAAEATLDLADNDLIVTATPETKAAVLAALSNAIKSGRAGGAWSGFGITSSAAKSDEKGKTGLGVRLNDQGEVIVKYTWNGDANLDGVVNADDYFLIDTGFLTQKAGYYNGDFNYDGVVNADDYFLIDSAFLGQSGPLAGGESAAATTHAAPEPADSAAVEDAVIVQPARKQEADSLLAELFSTKPVL